MAGFRLTTKVQVSGWRFLLRRVEHAIVRRDTRMFDDPLQFYSRAVSAGIALAVIICLGAALLAYFKTTSNVESLKRTLMRIMLAPPTLTFHLELGTTPENGRIRLTDFEIASRLSYRLTGAPPDDGDAGTASSSSAVTGRRDPGRWPRRRS